MTRTLAISLVLVATITGCSAGSSDPIELIPAAGGKPDAPGSATFALTSATPDRQLYIVCRAGRACSVDLSLRRTIRETYAGSEMYVASVHIARSQDGALVDFDYYERRPTHDNPNLDSWVFHGAPGPEFGIGADESWAPVIYLRSSEIAERFVITISRTDWSAFDDVQLGVGAVWN